MGAIAGYGAQILAASGTSTTFADEAMTDAGNHQDYTITNTAHRYWDDSVAVVIQESTDSGATWHTATPDVVQYVGGKIHYNVARTSTYLYRAHSGKYFTITTIGGGHEWDLTATLDLYDITEFGETFHNFIGGQVGGVATISRYWVDQYFWSLLATGNARGIIALYTNSTSGQRYEGYAYMKQVGEKAPTKGVVEDSLSFQFDKPLYYNPGP